MIKINKKRNDLYKENGWAGVRCLAQTNRFRKGGAPEIEIGLGVCTWGRPNQV